MTLDDAFERVIATHPDLRIYRHTQAGLTAEAERAALPPPLVARLELENAPGTGSLSGVRGAEVTLSLASVLERGGKREARRALAASRIDALGVRRAATELDLLADVARRYLDVVAAQGQSEIAGLDLAQRERALGAARQRVAAGASPASVSLMAEAMVSRARLDRARAEAQAEGAWRRLAILWGEPNAGSAPALAPLPLHLAELPAFAALEALLRDSPDLRRFADESRIREARVQLARTAGTPDIDWQAGVRRLQGEDAWALVGGVSVALGSARRAGPEVRAATAELEALALEHESAELALAATLAQAHGQYVAARTEVEFARTELLPRLVRAEQAAERAYRAGALSALEWAQLQNESTAARSRQLVAVVEAYRALIEIQRLTAEPFVLATDAFRDSKP
ncbi:MAG TPA: TolC family protein [Quisquiliibacterium sp.]|nr:TolC family protein [Quisquiliibacterium sp.]